MSDGITDSHVNTFCYGHINTDRNVVITPNTCNTSERNKGLCINTLFPKLKV